MGNARALRADWTTYIQQQVSNHRQGNAVQSLLSHLKWANYEEYNRGISKLWLTRIASESLLGLAKKVVAERYVLACVVDNRCVDICFWASRIDFGVSISGKWMSAVQMAQEFAGMPSRTDSTNLKTKEANLGLFLPGWVINNPPLELQLSHTYEYPQASSRWECPLSDFCWTSAASCARICADFAPRVYCLARQWHGSRVWGRWGFGTVDESTEMRLKGFGLVGWLWPKSLPTPFSATYSWWSFEFWHLNEFYDITFIRLIKVYQPEHKPDTKWFWPGPLELRFEGFVWRIKEPATRHWFKCS